ncbi:MAG: BlaI/MecI/CopY family transcriptional regulator [Acidobacteriota bacterium]|nr:BlaI/MecI/CopY family transcriptional regulator [Acidobacteriota bacterium]
MKKQERPLTDAELEIMHVVWEMGSGTVRQVHEHLNQRRTLAYTTVMTMMGILEEKGHLTRIKQGRAYLYQPVRPKSQVIAGMVDDFVGKVFEGSARPLVLSLIKDRKLSKKDIEEIARLIEEAE